MKLLHYFTLVLLFIATSSYANVVGPGGGGVVWSLQCDGYLVKVPAGWILDNQLAARHGMDMFFLPTEAPRVLSTNMPVFAYVMPAVKVSNSGQKVTVQGMIDYAVQSYLKRDASTKVLVSVNDWGLDSKDRKVTLAQITAPTLGKFEAIAYDEDEQSIFEVALVAKSAELLAEKKDFLKQIVLSAKIIHNLGAKPPCPILPIGK